MIAHIWSENYSSITKGEVGVIMSDHLQVEINDELLTIADKPCLCTHALGEGCRRVGMTLE